MPKPSEAVMTVIDGGKQYLARNDLDGFYKYMWDENVPNRLIGRTTEFLYECGVDVLEHLNNGEIPKSFTYGISAPKAVFKKLQGHRTIMVKLPEKFHTIGSCAFTGSLYGADLDLRGIKRVDRNAFGDNSFYIVIVDNNWSQINHDAFLGTTAHNVYIPDEDFDEWTEKYKDIFWYGKTKYHKWSEMGL